MSCKKLDGYTTTRSSEYLPRWYLLNHSTFCNQTWYGGVLIMSRSVLPKKKSSVFKVKVTARAYISVCTISSKLLIRLQPNLVWWYIIKYQSVMWKTKQKLDYCVQGQGHRKMSKYHWMFVQARSSELLNLLLPNFV